MRIVTRILLAALIASTCGCQWFRSASTATVAAPVVFEQTPNINQLVESVNANSARVRQLSSKVQVSVNGLPQITGNLAIERPNRIRLEAGLFGIDNLGVDLGSNDEQFWIWSKSALPGQQPAILFANHREYRESEVRQHFSFEPAWISDAMGLVEFTADQQHRGPFPRSVDSNYEIHSTIPTPTGELARVTVIDPRTGVIRQQTIYDEQRNRVAYIDSYRHQYFADYQVSLPRRIEIHLNGPDGKPVEINVDILSHSINSLYGSEQLWTMPKRGDVPMIDITKVPVDQLTGVPLGKPGTTTPRLGSVPGRASTGTGIFGGR